MIKNISKPAILLLAIAANICYAQAQELFVFTEPASNMPSKSIGISSSNYFAGIGASSYNYHTMPQIMVGISKKIMFHADATFSNNDNSFGIEGGSVYAKYRFLSSDELHKHFRMAAFARFSNNVSEIHQEEIETMGHNSGFEVGCIATKLIHKLAINSTISFEKAFDNGSYIFPASQSDKAINYSASFGKLIYPKKYINFKQTNINVMVEFLGQTLVQNNKSYLDVAPAIQFIFNSQLRVDLAYKHQLFSTMQRLNDNAIFIKLDYTFFNVFK
jgi:hypothetical protein